MCDQYFSSKTLLLLGMFKCTLFIGCQYSLIVDDLVWKHFWKLSKEGIDYIQKIFKLICFVFGHIKCVYEMRSIWARPWENVSYAICEEQRRRSACASAQSDQRLRCSMPRQNDTSSFYIRNFKILASLCSWAGRFVSCLVEDSRRYIFSWRGWYRSEGILANLTPYT